MASLTGQTIASTYDALLKISDNGPINGTLKQITDGLGNNTPLYLSGNTVSIDGSFKLTGRLFDKNNESGVAGQFLVSSGDGVDWQNISESGLITGTGTASFLSKFTAGGVIANSIVSESASGIGIGITATQKLHVLGNGLFTGTLNSLNLSGSSSGTNTGDETNATIKTKLGQVSPSNDGYLNSVDYESFLNKVPQTRTITINGETFDLSANRTYAVNVGVTSFNTRAGAVSLSSLDVTNALGYTPAIDSRIMTINGVGYSLAADRTWNVGTVTSVGTSAPLTGGTITGSGTIGISQSNTTTDGYLSATDWNTFNNKQANLGYTPENLANKGINNGYASLGGDGKVPSTQLPSYVDDVVEVANFAALPATGETGKIYVTLDNDFVYRWSGTVYVRISSPNAIWGSITGTLSNQIDLQNALNAKVSSVGLDLGTSGTDVNVANSPITSSGNITLNLPTASATNRGLLSSADWTTFNNKQNALTLTTTGTSGASTLVGSTLNIPQYQPQLSGTGFVKISGTTISYDNSSYALASAISGTTNYIPKFTGVNTIGNSTLQTDTSGNLGLGVTPSAWSNNWRAIQLNGGSIFNYLTSEIHLGQNFYYSTSAIANYQNNGFASDYWQYNGQHIWMTAPSGTAGNAITFTQAMTLGANGILSLPSSGSLEIGYSSSPSLYKLDVNGTGRFSAGGATTSSIEIGSNDNATISSKESMVFQVNNTGVVAGRGFAFRNGGKGYGDGTLLLEIASTGAATFSSSVTSLAASGQATIIAEGSATNGEGAIQVKGKNSSGVSRLAQIKYDNSDVIRIGTSSAIGMQFETNDVPRMFITSGGYLKATSDGTYISSTSNVHEITATSNGAEIIILRHKATNPYGQQITWSGATPNNGANWFHYCQDATAVRFIVNSNGGISNYQANNVNLSDERTKKDIVPIESYWDKFKDIEIVKFKYKDQTHDDYNIGVIAQQVEKVAPEFIDVDGFGEIPEDGIPLKTVYTSDLHHATIKVLQEAMVKIEILEQKITQLENK